MFNWSEDYLPRYDATSCHLFYNQYTLRVDLNNTTNDVHLIIYIYGKNPEILVKRDDFISVEMAKKFAERWLKMEFLIE